ncbi:uncharacterized protein L3040_007210 [Drepanopeziza brunnea f. sp. 'multigermtubi']|uniref:uncharacterized protein n=1 Tax=Drepanopeziza brunnea f. sp. 'multigermtubi' TaxID=698441 RepID=UPI002386DD1C|nr:hypothetical protein L3040_007210 [Drepanopeziza brunnea f. sp. 'multigermtubi']
MTVRAFMEEPLADTGAGVLQQLLTILGSDFAKDLGSSLTNSASQSVIRLKINAEICSVDREEFSDPPLTHTGYVDFPGIEVRNYLLGHVTSASLEDVEGVLDDRLDLVEDQVSAPQTSNSGGFESRPINPGVRLNKRRRTKTTGTFRVTQPEIVKPQPPSGSSTPAPSTARQLQTNNRDFPQRKKKSEDDHHQLLPSSVERFIAGLWKQVFSSVEITRLALESEFAHNSLGGNGNIEDFRAINSLCLDVTKMSRCSRALETVIQAHWVDCYEARVKTIGAEKPFLSSTETRMTALREACSILRWSEKELRNKLSIWRGYREIKDAGGWASLIFAGSGIYRFCKYRGGFGKNLTTRLEKLRPSLEVAADTLHPDWRDLLSVIGQESQALYTGHPHDWVVCDGKEPVTLKSTYTQWYPDFEFTHIEDSVLDPAAWDSEDPRRVSSIRTIFCNECGYFQSGNVSSNECRCFPELYGSSKAQVPVQVFRTPLGKNNGLIARCDLPRGSAIGEFTGLITKGMDGIDVMQSGSDERKYQIFQGRMGNYTRFINHSCAPNSQFQKFSWLGTERIILVSRGVEAGSEVTVDYSHEYWEGLDKVCLCGEPCCRYTKK